MHDSPYRDLVMWLVLAIIYYAVAVAAGVRGMADFKDFMFGDFRDYWAVYGDRLTPSWNNPFLLMIAAVVFLIGRLRGLINASRAIAAFIAGVFLVRLAVYVLDLYPVPMSLGYAALGVGAFIWYVATALLVSDNLSALLERLRAD